MLLFDYKTALKGNHLCKLKNGLYAILYADLNNDTRIFNENNSPLLGVVFNHNKVPYPSQWTYGGAFKSNNHFDIIGILDKDELDTFNNAKILKEAFANKNKVTWDDNPFKDPVAVTEFVSDMFVLSSGLWSCTTSGADMKNLRIVN